MLKDINEFYRYITNNMEKSRHEFKNMTKENDDFITRIQFDQER